MRRGGQILADVMEMLRGFVKPGLSTLEIDEEVEEFIVARGATPAFKGYRGFPATVCISINEEIVHGIPSAHRRVKEGDIVGLDLGCIVEGYYADCAFTMPIGEIPARVQELLDVTRQSLDLAITQCRPGQRLSDISHAVQRHVEAHGFGVVRAFVGHGIGRNLHEDPQIPNFGEPGHGPQLKTGMVVRADGDDGFVRHPHPGRRVDGGHQGRQPGGALRAHHRRNRQRTRCADPTSGVMRSRDQRDRSEVSGSKGRASRGPREAPTGAYAVVREDRCRPRTK